MAEIIRWFRKRKNSNLPPQNSGATYGRATVLLQYKKWNPRTLL